MNMYKKYTPDGIDVMLYLDGQDKLSFHCECGCNVFQKAKEDSSIRICNSCAIVYETQLSKR